MTETVANGSVSRYQNGISGKSNGHEINFHINGVPYEVSPSSVSVDTSLNTFIRNYAHLPGTKFMCLEGGCGACVVTATKKDILTEDIRSYAINSCLTPVYACDGLHITTVEGIGNKKIDYHPIQKRLAEFNGTQCGYCSPGMVMEMYSLWEAKNGQVTMNDIENSFGGNICRCTGYRPILDAFKSLAIDADPKYKEMCTDIEDLPKVCPKTGNSCNGNCSSNGTFEKLPLHFPDGKEWRKAKDLSDLFHIWEEIGNTPYTLIAGNTAHGVYRRNPSIGVFIDVNNIEELQKYTMSDRHIYLGGNKNLTHAMDLMEMAAKSKDFEYCEEIRKHIDLIANVPVRNAGTIAGNLSIKHAHNEFPSDLFVILDAVNAQITIAKKDSFVQLTMEEYLKHDMNKSLILDVILKPLDRHKYKFKSYKIMQRAQNAHAYVNAGFLFELDSNNILKSCNLCYGGIRPEFLRATNTERYLIGKNPFSNETLNAAIAQLNNEIKPDHILPDACPEYRKNLAIALFYKFILSICPEHLLKPEIRSGKDILERPISTGIQTFDTYKDKWPMTQPVQKVEGLVQCSGEAQYINDIPNQPGELWAAFVPGTEVHGKILAIDATDALKIPGVRYFFSAKDIPGENNFSPKNFGMSEVEEIFCSEIIKFYGQPVGVILADSFNLANKAASKVKVAYKKSEKKILPTLKDVYENSANELDRFTESKVKLVAKTEGNTTNKLVKGHFEIQGQYHYTLEPQTTVCIPIEDGMDVYCATQWVDFVQVAIAKSINVPECSLNIQLRRLGGAYGAKITRASQIACACAIGAKLTNRPVRFVMSMESNMTVIGKRHGLISDYEVYVDENGKIHKLKNDFSQDIGCNINEDPIFATVEFFKNCYNTDTWNVVGKKVRTDSAANTWCRAPGTTEGIASIENIIEHIARETGLDPNYVRLANIPEDNKMKTLLPEFLESVDYKRRKVEIEEFNEKNRWRKRGIAVVPMHYPQGFFGAIPVVVSIYHTDGTVAITHGGVECGQGMNTKVVQVAAHTLNIPMEYIKIKPSLNSVTPNSGVTGGSMTSEAVCYATKRACETLLERMKPIREKLPQAKWHEITNSCYGKSIDLSSSHLYKAEDVQGYSTWGLSCAEVEVDILTGNFQLKRVDILEDTGESISPYVDVGQVEGAFIMGLGYWLTESLIYDKKTGELMTNRSWNYKPPGAKDIPIDFRVTFLRNSTNPLSVLRSKATGEPALCMSIVGLFALRHALESARKDAGIEEWLNLGAPTTPERIFLAAATTSDMLRI